MRSETLSRRKLKTKLRTGTWDVNGDVSPTFAVDTVLIIYCASGLYVLSFLVGRCWPSDKCVDFQIETVSLFSKDTRKGSREIVINAYSEMPSANRFVAINLRAVPVANYVPSLPLNLYTRTMIIGLVPVSVFL